MYGWHVIKLLDKRGIPSFEDAKPEIKSKIKRDSRSNRGVESLISKIKKEYNFSEKEQVILLIKIFIFLD